MRNELNIQPEAFEFESEFGNDEAWSGESSGGLQQEANRGSRDYIRWLQDSLNRILGLKLTADGIMGTQTRSAIRSFQQRKRLSADGIVGPATERALIEAGAAPPPGAAGAVCPPRLVAAACPPRSALATEVLDNFVFDRDALSPTRHVPRIVNVARRVITSQRSKQPIRSILVAGHTDPVGAPTYNLELGRRRATRVAQELCNTLERMRPGSARLITFRLTSCGEDVPKATPELSRRVEIFLPKSAPAPKPPPQPKPKPQPAPTPPPPQPAPKPQPTPAPVTPPDLNVLITLLRQILGKIPLLGRTGVKLPTTARFLSTAEQSEAMKVFVGSLDFTKILISDGLGFDGRPFTVAVPLSSGSHVVMNLGDLDPWETSFRSNTLIHELVHAWQSQHHGSDPRAFMMNSVECQARALAALPIAKAEAGKNAAAAAVARGEINPVTLAGIARAAASAEDVSAYAYVPSTGKTFVDFAAEQIAEQVEDGYRRRGRPMSSILPVIRGVSANVRSPENEASLQVISFHRKSTPGVVFH